MEILVKAFLFSGFIDSLNVFKDCFNEKHLQT